MSNLNNTSSGLADNSVGGTYTTPNNPNQSASVQNSTSAPYEGTGTSQYGNNVDSTTSGTADSTGTKAGGAASGVKNIAAAVHGAGEKIRGTFNKGVDDAFDEPTGSAKNASIARDGDNEINSGNFSSSTKNREGALPGSDYEKQHRHGQMTDLNRE